MNTTAKRFLTVIGYVLVAIAVGFLIEVLLSLQLGAPFGHTNLGHLVGWLGLVVTLTVFVYSIKKRYARKAGWPKGWFLVHQVAGIAGPLLILVHAGSHFHALVPVLAMVAMGMVSVSGVIGVAVHRKVLSLLSTQRKELLAQGVSHQNIEERLFELASDEEAFRIWQIIHVPMVLIFLVLAVAHVIGALYFGGL